MSEIADETDETIVQPEVEDAGAGKARDIDEAERKLVAQIRNRVRADKKHWGPAFERMARDMKLARDGAPKAWKDARKYTANITGRHIKQLVSTLYAKNPKATARRRERLDFAIWDETEESLQMAQMTLQQFSQMAAMTPPMVDPMTGMAVPSPMPQPVMDAQALLTDFQEGMTARQTIDKVGKTLEVMFNYYMGEQKPLVFKEAMKQVVRRAATCGVAYVEVGFQRQHERNAVISGQIADVRAQVEHIRVLAEDLQDLDKRESMAAQQRELELSLAALAEQEYVLLREGLVFDYPEATRVIPHKRARNLVGFVGADWVTIEYLYTAEEVRRLFNVDLGRKYRPSLDNGDAVGGELDAGDYANESGDPMASKDGLACVWKVYDRVAGVVYYVCDGHPGFLRQPAAPDVYVEGFWPVHALVFNAVEDPTDIFPPSDVSLLYDMQLDWNRSRQGKREHRAAAIPRFLSRKGVLDDEVKEMLSGADPFSVIEVNPVDGDPDLAKIVQPVAFPGVDPNLYDVNEIAADMQVVVGRSPAQLGASNRSTATGEAIAEEAGAESSSSNVDDLDGFLSAIARDAGQIMLRELSPETVSKIAGRGAVWPQLTLEDLAGEVYLEIEAGSSGKPNAAQEIRNWREMLPFLIQIGKINPMWLAKESLRRLDDRMDLTDAIGEQFLPIIAMARSAGMQMGSDPGADPAAQGPEGGGNGAPAPSAPAGGERGMGANNFG
jgi:hypothetical protein